MNLRKLTSLVLLFLMTVSTPALPISAIPRKSPDFTISEPSGKTIMLSSFRGKVVALEFLFVRSTHCAHVAMTLNKLNGELGPRGFQPVVIAFDAPDPSKTGGQMLPAMVENLKLTYPAGYANREAVDNYLGRTGKEILAIPQVVVIDRNGMIRAVTGDRTNPSLEDENSLRTLLDVLLKENPPAATGKSRP